jgi:hydroxyacylglutathione hydrolase
MGVSIQKFINDAYNANTYLISSATESPFCYLIDIGNAQAVLNDLKKHQEIKAVFLTHPHYDHICGIHAVLEQYPGCLIYCSPYTKKALADAKTNLSFYQGTPITYEGTNVVTVRESDSMDLFEDTALEIIETPGHNEGSLTFKIGHAIFTGDSLIPKIPVVTKLKTGNKLEARQSISKIRNKAVPHGIIYPGHGNAVPADAVDWNFYLQ